MIAGKASVNFGHCLVRKRLCEAESNDRLRPAAWGVYIDAMGKFKSSAGLIGVLGMVLVGCGKKDDAPAASSTPSASPDQTPTATDPNAGIDLAQMTRDLRRWILAKQRPPKNFEDYAATATATIPTPPPGKKFAISKEMAVVLVKK